MIKPYITVEAAEKITNKLIKSDWSNFPSFLKSKKLKNVFNSLEKPKVTWKKFGFQVAGRAYPYDNEIEMNINFLYSPDYKKFISSTFKHELAHIIAFELYGELNHKQDWKKVAIALGDDGSTCHNYSDPINKPINKNRVHLICKHGCEHVVTKNMFNKFQTGGYLCTNCNHNMLEAKICK